MKCKKCYLCDEHKKYASKIRKCNECMKRVFEEHEKDILYNEETIHKLLVEEINDLKSIKYKHNHINPELYTDITKHNNIEKLFFQKYTSKLDAVVNSNVFKEIAKKPNTQRAYSAAKSNIKIIDFPTIKCKMISTKDDGSENEYTVSLNDCTCTYYQKRNKPCKHMYFLAIQLGALSNETEKKIECIVKNDYKKIIEKNK